VTLPADVHEPLVEAGAEWSSDLYRIAASQFERTADVLDLDDELVAAAGLPGVSDRAPDSVLFSRGVETRFGSAAPAARVGGSG